MSAVPKLRFPEFKTAYASRYLGDEVSKISSGKTKAEPDGDYKLYGSTGVLGNTNSPECHEQNILIARVGANAGALNIVEGSYGVTDNTLILSATETSCLNYIFYFLKSFNLNRLVFGSGQPLVTGGMIKKLKFSHPALPEQQKIASFLSSVDKKIDLLRQKKDALELYKKGLMQKIFSQEIRFKQEDGSDFPDWEEVALGEVVRIDSGFAFKSIKFKEHGTNRVIRMSDLKASEIAKTGGVYVEDSDVNGLEKFKLSESDFVFGMSGSLSNYGWIKKSDLPAYLNQRVGRISDNGKSNALFIQYIYLLPQTQNLIENSAVGAAQLNISIDFLRNMTFPCPTYEEQNKIASFLFIIDAKIQNTSSQIEQIETFKKGLLQQMFV